MGNGPEFFQTPMGRRFYESTVPDIATALLRIAERMENPPAASVPVRVWRKANVEWERITALLNMLADAGEGECFCRLTLDPDGPCPCVGGDCDGCSECPTGKARSILVAVGLA
jgi:hypothetical protein